MLTMELVKIEYEPESHMLIVSTPYKHTKALCLTTDSALDESRKLLEEYRKELGHE